MCWITNEKWRTRPRIAKRRIEVWKVYTNYFCIDSSSFILHSPYMNMPISKRLINSVLHSHLDCPIESNSKLYKIERGFHSFKKGNVFFTRIKELITTSNNYRFYIVKNSIKIPVVMKCWIPVGAEYYVSEYSEYVSNKIIIENAIPYNKLPTR